MDETNTSKVTITHDLNFNSRIKQSLLETQGSASDQSNIHPFMVLLNHCFLLKSFLLKVHIFRDHKGSKNENIRKMWLLVVYFLSVSISLKCFWYCNIFCRNYYVYPDYILSAEPYASKNLYICINFNDIPKLGLNNEEHHTQIDMSVLDIIWTPMTNIGAGYWYLILNHFLLLFHRPYFHLSSMSIFLLTSLSCILK